MKNWLTICYKKIDALSLREQIIFLVLAILIIYFIWDLVLFAPTQQKKSELQRQTEQVKIKLSELKVQIEQSNKEISAKSLGMGKLERPVLQTDKIIPMMTELMNKQPGLELISISTRPAEPVKLDDIIPSRINPNQAEAAKMAADKAARPGVDNGDKGVDIGLFRHAITIQFRGDYFSTLQFLEKIESLPWLLVYDNISYSVTTYPQANVIMQLNLLSLAGGIV